MSSGVLERIVIVGGGPAAQAAAQACREAGGAGPVTILAREADPPYERPPLTKDFLRGESGRDALPLVDRGWYAERAIDLRTGVEVTELDLSASMARAADGEMFPFERLLLATGADPLVPPIPGADGSGVQTMRRVGDAERLAELGRGAQALVVGSGFIGCEAAASLAMRGAAVTMATLEAAPPRSPGGSKRPVSRSSPKPSWSRSGPRATERRAPASPTAMRPRSIGSSWRSGWSATTASRWRPESPSTTGSRSALRWSRRIRGSSRPAMSPSPSTAPPVAVSGSNTGARH
jgi:hypothetical protein